MKCSYQNSISSIGFLLSLCSISRSSLLSSFFMAELPIFLKEKTNNIEPSSKSKAYYLEIDYSIRFIFIQSGVGLSKK
jgi:hypothetical protein